MRLRLLCNIMQQQAASFLCSWVIESDTGWLALQRAGRATLLLCQTLLARNGGTAPMEHRMLRDTLEHLIWFILCGWWHCVMRRRHNRFRKTRGMSLGGQGAPLVMLFPKPERRPGRAGRSDRPGIVNACASTALSEPRPTRRAHSANALGPRCSIIRALAGPWRHRRAS